jgi:manganese transport system substrate-binding protein
VWRFRSVLFFCLLLSLSLAVAAGCTSSVQSTAGKKQVLTTFTVIADMARNVAGDLLEVASITKPGMEIHGYEPTPQDIVRAQKADLILDNGLNLEAWAQRFYSNLPHVPRVTLSEGITPIPIKTGEYQGKPNPHAWMSPRNALIYVSNIAQAFSKVDSAHAETYAQNARRYQEAIQNLDRKLRRALEAIPSDRRFVVSCEGAFSYLAKDYGLQEVYIWAVNDENQGTPQQIARVIQQVKQYKIPTLFCESTVSDRTMKQIAQQTGARYGGVFYVDSLTASDGEAPTYLALLEHNINTLIKGLS